MKPYNEEYGDFLVFLLATLLYLIMNNLKFNFFWQLRFDF